MAEELITLADLIESGTLSNLDIDPSSVSSCEIKQCQANHHSHTGLLNLEFIDDLREPLSIFFKKSSVKEPTSCSTEDLAKLNRLEAFVSHLFGRLKSGFVPQFYGAITQPEHDRYLLFLEYVLKTSAVSEYAQLARRLSNATITEEIYQREKEQLLWRDFSQIARFNGFCRANSRKITRAASGFFKRSYNYKREVQEERILKYLLYDVYFSSMGGREFWETDGQKGKSFDQEQVLKYIQQTKKLNLREKFDHIIALRRKIKFQSRLQMGDCQLHHNLGGTFCDLQDFGEYNQTYDLANYSGEELASPEISKLPLFLAWYFLNEQAISSKSKSVNLEEVEELTQEDENQIRKLREKFIHGTRDPFADFTVSYFVELIEDDIIKNGVRKKYTKTQMDAMTKHYPRNTFPLDKLLQTRVDHLSKIYQFLTPESGVPSFFGKCQEPDAPRKYLHCLGSTLEKLGLIEVPNLESLATGTNYELFFKIR